MELEQSPFFDFGSRVRPPTYFSKEKITPYISIFGIFILIGATTTKNIASILCSEKISTTFFWAKISIFGTFTTFGPKKAGKSRKKITKKSFWFLYKKNGSY